MTRFLLSSEKWTDDDRLVEETAKQICQKKGWVDTRDIYVAVVGDLTHHKGDHTNEISLRRISMLLRSAGYTPINPRSHGRTKYKLPEKKEKNET
ncbi:MAG TPA: hypothetical protein O0X39_01220 [Methanocorpusculum sp.]|nr:hypothetical protein [Methanocorpusculum sp.]